MAKNQNVRREKVSALSADQKAFLSLKTISDYRPINPAYAIEAMDAKYEALLVAEEAERKAHEALSAARQVATAAGVDFHNAIQGVKAQVIAQYGPDSDQVVLLGLKRKSDRKARARKSKAAAKTPETDQK